MFKLPSKESQNKLVDLYKTLSTTATKNGKPYILTLEAGPLFEDPRSQGFTFASKSEFATKEDMAYYDDECEAHKVLKVGAKDLGVEGIMTIYYDPVISQGV